MIIPWACRTQRNTHSVVSACRPFNLHTPTHTVTHTYGTHTYVTHCTVHTTVHTSHTPMLSFHHPLHLSINLTCITCLPLSILCIFRSTSRV